MAQFKAVQFFSDRSGRGFTEDWYLTGNDPISAFNNVLPIFTARDFLTSFYTSAIKVSDVTNPKNEYTQYYPTGINAPSLQPNIYEDCILANAQASTGKIRVVYFRAIQDNWVVRASTGPILYPINSTFQGYYDSWVALAKKGLQIRQRDTTQVHNYMVPNTGVVVGPDGYVIVTLQTTTNLLNNSKIVVTGFKEKLAELNGTYGPHQYGITGSNVALNKMAVSPDDVPAVLNGVAIQNSAWVYNNVTSIQINPAVVGTRKLGQSFRLRRGRARNRA